MQSVCTQTDASTTNCVYSGTSTIAVSSPVEAYSPFLDVTLAVTLWILVATAVVALILKFK